jgi:hypothetical protein
LFTLLTGRIKIEQEQIQGVELIPFDPLYIEIWNVDDTEIIAEIDLLVANKLYLTIPPALRHRQQSSMSELIGKVMPFLDQQHGFNIKYSGVSQQKLESGGFGNKVFGLFKGDLVKIPVDELDVDTRAIENVLSFEITIEFL